MRQDTNCHRYDSKHRIFAILAFECDFHRWCSTIRSLKKNLQMFSRQQIVIVEKEPLQKHNSGPIWGSVVAHCYACCSFWLLLSLNHGIPRITSRRRLVLSNLIFRNDCGRVNVNKATFCGWILRLCLVVMAKYINAYAHWRKETIQ